MTNLKPTYIETFSFSSTERVQNVNYCTREMLACDARYQVIEMTRLQKQCMQWFKNESYG